MQKIGQCIWLDGQAEEASKFYASVFKNTKVLSVSHYDKASAKVSGQPEGSVLTVEMEIEGQNFTLLNGGPLFKLTEAISFVINCETQEEIDHYWTRLSAHKESEQCGWLKDKFGVSWQVVPSIMGALMSEQNPKKSQAVMAAMLRMHKLDIAKLQEVYDNA